MYRMRRTLANAAVVLALLTPVTSPAAPAELPPPPTAWADWPTAWSPDDPGELSAADLLPKPAGRNGPVVVRDGHFYTGADRVRFWGVNLAFSANFPTHEMADKLARRFARYGINAVRFHHMDNQPFPNGIFADSTLTALSPEALDRLDYFVAALKAEGVYADLNLHVSRNYRHYHRTADGRDGPAVDKIVDLFDPELVAAQRQYAQDLLTHVNAYTHARYADEPAVALVEINNENSLFMWGAEQKLAELPEPYAGELKRQWNDWLADKYHDRAKLAAAWAAGSTPAGPNLLRDPAGTTAGKPGSPWHVEQHDGAALSAVPVAGGVRLTVAAVDGTEWHAQFQQGGFAIHKGETYRGRVTVRADHPVTIAFGVGQAHAPWQSLGGYRTVHVTAEPKTVPFGFTAAADEPNARLNFSVGNAVAAVDLTDLDLHAGGAAGLAADEDLGTVHVHNGDPESAPRHDDWYRFLVDDETATYHGLQSFLHDLGVKCPITGTIGFGPLGTYVQSKMDFVDAHAYWEHPTFPHKQWDGNDWRIENKPMVDDPAHATLWSLAATRVAGKPFTVTEYQHPAPNDWAAECVPEIATFAALQDWDGVFLFAYSHNQEYDKGRIASFFDIEGNPTKMPLMPIGGPAVPRRGRPAGGRGIHLHRHARSGVGRGDWDGHGGVPPGQPRRVPDDELGPADGRAVLADTRAGRAGGRLATDRVAAGALRRGPAGGDRPRRPERLRRLATVRRDRRRSGRPVKADPDGRPAAGDGRRPGAEHGHGLERGPHVGRQPLGPRAGADRGSPRRRAGAGAVVARLGVGPGREADGRGRRRAGATRHGPAPGQVGRAGVRRRAVTTLGSAACGFADRRRRR